MKKVRHCHSMYRNVYGGCIKYLLRHLSVIEFGQFGSEILYNDIQPKYKISHITHFKIKQILTGEDGPLKLNLLKTANINSKNWTV